MEGTILRQQLAVDDDSWDFKFTPAAARRQSAKPNVIYGKMISLRNDGIRLHIIQFPSNRILIADDPSKFVLFSVEKRFRFEEQPMRVATDYIIRMLKRGVHLNGVQYRFYGHSNSQLVRILIFNFKARELSVSSARPILLLT
jgi:hypothetical protein